MANHALSTLHNTHNNTVEPATNDYDDMESRDTIGSPRNRRSGKSLPLTRASTDGSADSSIGGGDINTTSSYNRTSLGSEDSYFASPSSGSQRRRHRQCTLPSPVGTPNDMNSSYDTDSIPDKSLRGRKLFPSDDSDSSITNQCSHSQIHRQRQPLHQHLKNCIRTNNACTTMMLPTRNSNYPAHQDNRHSKSNSSFRIFSRRRLLPWLAILMAISMCANIWWRAPLSFYLRYASDGDEAIQRTTLLGRDRREEDVDAWNLRHDKLYLEVSSGDEKETQQQMNSQLTSLGDLTKQSSLGASVAEKNHVIQLKRSFSPFFKDGGRNASLSLQLPYHTDTISFNRMVLLERDEMSTQQNTETELREWLPEKEVDKGMDHVSEDELAVRSQTVVWENDRECIPMAEWQSTFRVSLLSFW